MRKISVEIPDELHEEFRAIQWGIRRHLIIAVLRLIIEAVKKDGNIMIAAIQDDKFKLVMEDGYYRSNAGEAEGSPNSDGAAAGRRAK